MARVTGPFGPRRSIGDAIRKLREDQDKVLTEVARDVGMSSSKLSRLEKAQGTPLPDDIRDLIEYYQIGGTPLAASLEQWVYDAGRRGWWTDYDDAVVEEGMGAHLAYEVDAAVERVYTLPFVPALLQTPEYARAVFRDMEDRSEEQIEKLLEVRARRQAALDQREGLGPLRLIAVAHESALHQLVGSPGIMRRQLDELIEHSAKSNVSLHVLRYTARPAFSMTCMYAHFEYKDAGEADIVNVETHAGYFSVEDLERVRRYRSAHDALVRASLTEEASREFIGKIRDSPRAYD